MQYQLGVVLFYILDIDVVPFIPPLVHNKYASDAAHSSPVATTGIGSNVPAKPQASNLSNNNNYEGGPKLCQNYATRLGYPGAIES